MAGRKVRIVTESHFTVEHELFRKSVRDFVEKEVIPNIEEWEKSEAIPKEIWKKMGDLGFLGINYPETYGGIGADFWYSVLFIEELTRSTVGGFGAAVSVHEFMAIAHLSRAGSDSLKKKYLAPSIAGTKLGALAITEAGAGSDVANLRTRAVREGDHYIINGSKTFITNGHYCDFATVAVKTDSDAGIGGMSLIIVDRDTPGFSSRKLKKIGWHCSDTAEMFFENVRVPVENLIGVENQGFYYLMESFQLERLTLAIAAVATADYAIEITKKYIREREVFGRPVDRYQVVRHKIVQLATELEAAKRLTYHAADLYNRGKSATKECSMAKLYTTELSKRVIDECMQCFGGFGFMDEYVISRLCRDSRVGTIVAGTSDIMREILGKIIIDDVSFEPAYNEVRAKASIPIQDPSSPFAVPQTANQMIRSFSDRLRSERASGYSAVVHFDISGENGGQFTVIVRDNQCVVLDGLEGQSDCKVRSADSHYEAIELGKMNPQMAVLTGKIKISDLRQMKKFSGMFKSLLRRDLS